MTVSPEPRRSHGTGQFNLSYFLYLGESIIVGAGVLIFYPKNIEIGHHVYIKHNTILKGYYKHRMVIGEGT